MCNLSEGILERGIDIGLERGELRTKCQAIRNLRAHMSIDEIVKIMQYEECFVKKVLMLLQGNPNATDTELVRMLQDEKQSLS